MKQLIIKNRGFSLIELLVVMGLTVIIMGLIFGPIMQSFNFTRQAGTVIRAQDNARIAMAKIKSDLQNAMFAYDNTRQPVGFYISDNNGTPPDPGDSAQLAKAYYAKIDLVLPRMHGYCVEPDSIHNPGGVNNPREFDRGDEAAPQCKYDGSLLELRPVQPLAPDTKIVRYFIGLENPTKPYANRYDPLLKTASGNNMFVLYRAEFSPFDTKLFGDINPSVNLAKSNFFYDNSTNGLTNPDGSAQTYAQAWKRISVAIVTPKYADLVQVKYDSTGKPVVTPTVTFAPTPVYNDPLVAVTDKNNDPERVDAPPAVYKAKYGNWILPYEVTVRRKRDGDNVPTIYKAMPRADNLPSEICIYRMLSNGKDPEQLVFDLDNYERTKTDKTYPGYPYGVGDTGASGINAVLPELAFTVDTKGGKVNFAFPHVDVELSNQLSNVFQGKIAASIGISTNVINQFYDSAPVQDRYRLLEFHHSDTRQLPYVSSPSVTFQADRILGNSTVVPGLERVIGPYSRDPGRSILYSRIPFYDMTAEPGPNQYKLDIEYPVRDDNGDTLSGMEGTAALYFHSAQAESGIGEPLPADRNIYLLYYEQNNKRGDSLRANYVTKELMTVTLGVRVYDSTTRRPQTVQLTSKVRLKNIAN
ncbi:MAG: PilW family protein [Armatimonadota bacterium]